MLSILYLANKIWWKWKWMLILLYMYVLRLLWMMLVRKASVTKFRCMWVSLCLHVTSGMSGTFLTSAHLSFSRGGTKLQSFLLVTISQHYTTHVLSRPHWLCSRTISLTEEHYLWCQLPGGVKILSYLAAESAARILAIMTRYVLVPSSCQV